MQGLLKSRLMGKKRLMENLLIDHSSLSQDNICKFEKLYAKYVYSAHFVTKTLTSTFGTFHT